MKIKVEAPIQYPHDVYVSENNQFEEVVLLLHGYQLDGRFMFKRYAGNFGPEVKVISPNGPFPVPLKKDNEWNARYSWYFYNSKEKNFYINYEPAAKWLCALLRQLNPQRKKTTVLGYSQGGYLAPKVAELAPETKKVVGINCVYRSTRFKVREDVEYHQVHALQDAIVSPQEAKEEFQRLKELGAQGSFVEIEATHLLNHALIRESLQLL